uniref:Reverse transcriptase domain-containing protein n=1 Tax=Sinocyclocheilus anshuiensis TaxID=1608454 RepID=A0A671QEF9_9TELE
MVKHLSETSLNIILSLFNKVWESGKLPADWKHGIIVPIAKPGKDHTQPNNYRPIALTSNLCKLMERMVMSRLVHIIEKKNLFSPYQSGFRKGRNTMDSVLCLEAEIRKAQVNKEVLVGVFFDVEKAYDMMWKEGLLIKLERMEIKGRMYNWIKNFLFKRTIQVRVGSALSQIYPVENGTPQGSVSSPVLFNLMIDDIFTQIDMGIGRSLYADDGALWKRGRNMGHVEKCMQNAVKKVENWANEWGFCFSVAKTQVICFTKRKINPIMIIKMYGQKLEQVSVIRFLGMWMDSKLDFRIHIQKIVDKGKKAINVMRCLAGVEWGACRQSLKRIYCALIRAAIDYGSMVYSSASKTQLLKIEAIQSQALRICCGAIRSSPIAAVQVEMDEMPQEIRRLKLKMRYWINIKGHLDSHPVKKVLKDCWEYEYKKLSSFGWTANEEAQNMGISDINIAPSVATSAIPPWLFPMPVVDIQLYEEKHNQERSMLTNIAVQQYIEQTYYSILQIYTDGSKDPESGITAAAVYIPQFKVKISKRISDHISVYTTETIAIFLALQWIEEVQPIRSVICTDSLSVLNSLLSGISTARQDIIFEVMQSLFRIRQSGLMVNFLWVPSHMGVEGNEEADHLAKQALRHAQIDIKVSMSKAEVKGLIANEIRKKWQKEWDSGTKGRHFHHIQEKVAGQERRKFGNRKEDVLMSRMRIGHCSLNQCLYRMGK